MSTEAQIKTEQYTLRNPEVDMFAQACNEFNLHKDYIERSSKLRGVKEVVYDQEYLRKIVGDLLRHRPANVRVRISHEENGEVREYTIDSSLVAFKGLLGGSKTPLFIEDRNSALLQYEVDTAFGLTDEPMSEAKIGAILLQSEVQEKRPLRVGIIDIRSDLPKIDVVARNVVEGIENFDQYADEIACNNGLDGQDSTSFVIRDGITDYEVVISKESPGGERVPGLDVQVGMLLLKQLGLPPEEAGNLGDLGPVYTEPMNVPTEDAF